MARQKRPLKLDTVKPIHQRNSLHRVHDMLWLNSLDIEEIARNLSIEEKSGIDSKIISRDINFAFNEYIAQEEASQYEELYKTEDDDWSSHVLSWVDEGLLIFKIYSSGLYFGKISEENSEALGNLISKAKPILREIDKTLSAIKDEIPNTGKRGRKFDHSKKELISSLKKVFTENYNENFSITTYEDSSRGGKALRWCQEIIRGCNNRKFVEAPLRNLAHWAEMPEALAGTIRWVNQMPKEGD